MAQAVFYSFHFDGDVSRVQQIRNIGALQEQDFLSPQRWEEVKRQGDPAIKSWIDREMKNKAAVVVLVGAQTASRPWVRYEIAKAWDAGVPLVGVRIHGLQNFAQQTDQPGSDPFARVIADGRSLSDWGVPLHNPPGLTSQQRYAYIRDNLPGWVNTAYKHA